MNIHLLSGFDDLAIFWLYLLKYFIEMSFHKENYWSYTPYPSYLCSEAYTMDQKNMPLIIRAQYAYHI